MITLIILSLLIANNDAARILAVLPTPSISHQVVFRPLTQELAKRGHEVVVITPDPAFTKGQAPENLTEIDVHDVSYEIWQKFFDAPAGRKENLANQIAVGFRLVGLVFEKQIQSEQVQEILRDKNMQFDLLMLESCARPALVFSHLYKVPVIQVSSFGAIFNNINTIGGSLHPFLYPLNMCQRVYNLSFWEKIIQLYSFIEYHWIYNSLEEGENEIMKKHFGDNVPSLSELANNVDMLFMNVHPIWDGNRPVPPSVVHMGGLPRKPERELPQELQSYLDSSKHGVIYISFGTNVKPSLLPPEKIQILANVFSKLPYDVLWKWDTDELPGRSRNIRISKWLPQPDLLRHPKIKLFITQGGLQSTDEAILAGVPLIGIPMIGDQWYNVEKYEYYNIGLKLAIDTLDEDIFMNAINTIIGNESYRQNSAKLRSLMNDSPQDSLERAVWWTEYVLRHGGARHLRAPSANMSWLEFIEFKFILILLLIILAIVTLFLTIMYFSFNFIYQYFNIKNKLKQC